MLSPERTDLTTGRVSRFGIDAAEAFERHQLLAIRYHRAVKVDSGGRQGGGAGNAWTAFFAAHFPRDDHHGDLLWRLACMPRRPRCA